jgi:4-amino-4-deoxy-L-arabinose transferase-like glycosyltransferase
MQQTTASRPEERSAAAFGATSARRRPGPRTLAALLLAAFCVVWFGNLDYRKLVRPDEGRYAEIAREMAASGDWVTPRLNGIKYFEKPPLQYWMTAAAFRAFGESEWTARLWSALTGFLGVLMVGFTGARLFGARAGLFAALVLASNILYAAIGHINTLDMGVTFCMTLGLACFLLAQREPAAGTVSRRWMLLAWAAMGLAILSKGLIGVVLPGAAMAIYAAIERDLSFLRRLRPLSGLAVLLAVTLPWFIAVSAANPEFARFFFIHEHFERFLTQAHHRVEPWWFFIAILGLGMLPWTGVMAATAAASWRADGNTQAFRARRFLMVYALVILAFFSVSQSKLPSYILPMFPALALLIGDGLERIRGRVLAALLAPVVLFALAVAVFSPWIPDFASEKNPEALYVGFRNWTLAGALALLAASALSVWWAWRDRIRPAAITLAAGGLFLVQLVMTGHNSLSPSLSAAQAAREIRPYLKPGIPFYSVQTYEQTLPFYIKRTVTLVDYRDELDFGLTQEPGLSIPTVAEFEARWRADGEALALMGPDVYETLSQRGLPMRLLTADLRRVIVAKP